MFKAELVRESLQMCSCALSCRRDSRQDVKRFDSNTPSQINDILSVSEILFLIMMVRLQTN